MDRRVRFSALSWAGCNFALILGLVILECMLLRFTYASLHLESFKVHPSSSYLFDTGLSIVFAAVYVVFSPRLAIPTVAQSKFLIPYKIGVDQPSWLGSLLFGLCSFRRKELPEIFIVAPNFNEHNMLAAILDLHGQKDKLILGSGLFKMMSREQLLGIIAHELRHSNAMENIILKVGTAMKMVVYFTIMSISFQFLTIFEITIATGFAFAVAIIKEKSTSYKTVFYSLLFNKTAYALIFTYLTITIVTKLFLISPPLFILIFLLVPLVLVSCFFIEKLASRATEYKTDVLAAMDMGTGRPLINALHHIHTTMNRNSLPDKLRPLGFMESLLGPMLLSHPPVEARIEVLNEIFKGNQNIRPELSNALRGP